MPINKKDLIPFYEKFETINNQAVIHSECNAISFYNKGTATVKINGRELFTGEQYVSEGNAMELNETVYQIMYPTGTTGTKRVEVVRKIYK